MGLLYLTIIAITGIVAFVYFREKFDESHKIPFKDKLNLT